jgi:hypothetical protein
MSELSADIIKVDGKRALRLRYSHIPRDPRHNDLLLVVENEDEDSADGALPFAYEFTPETAKRPYAILKIVTGPGVSVRHSFPAQYAPMIDKLPLLYIYRLQDPEQVPPMGVEIVERQLLAPYQVNPLESTSPNDEVPTNYFQVVPRMNGTVIRHPASGTEMHVTVPPDRRASGDASDGGERYAFEIVAPAVQVGNNLPTTTVIATPGVKVGFATIPRTSEERPVRLSPLVLTDFFRVYTVKEFAEVPRQGEQLTPDEKNRVTRFDRVPSLQETLTLSFIDVSIGFVPVLGDLVDIAEFAYGLVTGEDRWGRPLSTTDLVLMGLGAMLPFIAAPVLRRGRQLFKTFGERVKTADDVLEGLEFARFGPKDADMIVAQTALIKKGRSINPQDTGQLINKIAHVEPKPLALDDLLNRDQSAFSHPELQKEYQIYIDKVLKDKKRTKPPQSPRDWALAVTGGRPRELLERILSKDYVKLAGGRGSVRPKLINAIPRPEGFTDELVEAQLALLADDPRLFERLGNLVDELENSDETIRALARSRIRAGHFRILKGNIAEILSRRKQLAALAAIVEQHKLADAVLISGLRIRLPKKLPTDPARAALLFSDNIIAVQRGGDLHVLMVFEVKSGFQGGAEATEQVFKWIERRVEDGTQLVLQRGAQFTRNDGTVVTLERELSFLYDPGSIAAGRVIGLQNAQRTLITAAGASHLGVDSSMQIAKEVRREVLDDLTSAHLDYLVGEIVRRFR